MKKLLITSAMMLTSLFSAAGTIGVDVDYVWNQAAHVGGRAHILRWNDTVDGINYGLSKRTVTYGSNPYSSVDSATLKSSTGWGMWNTSEISMGKTYDIGLPIKISPYVGFGYDDGKNGAVGTGYGYGRVGINTSIPIGPGHWNTGFTTRVNYESDHLNNRVWSNNYSIPLNDKFSVSLRITRNWQNQIGVVPKTIEDYRGVGITYKF